MDREFYFSTADITTAMNVMQEADSKYRREFERVLSGEELTKYIASKKPNKSLYLHEYYQMNKYTRKRK